jgi:phage repressor protein C with HTH and peptisase S24 domain
MQAQNREITKIVERLDEFRSNLALSKTEFAEKLGVKLDAYSGMIRKGARPTPEVLEIAVKLGANAHWLLTGEGAMRAGEPRNAPTDGEFVFVRNYAASVSAGPGSEPDDNPASSLLAFRRDWLHHAVGSPVRDLFGIQVDGESMEPTLRNRDTVLVDRTKAGSRIDGIYVVRDEGVLKVKRLAFVRGHRVRVISDNAAYPAQEIEEGAPDFTVLGRVVWIGRSIANGG